MAVKTFFALAMDDSYGADSGPPEAILVLALSAQLSRSRS